MANQIGHCVQCSKQIMVQDTNGRWSTFKPNHREADLVINATRIRVHICEDCLEHLDREKIISELIAEGSQCGKRSIQFIKQCENAEISSVTNVRRRFGMGA